MPIKQSNKSEFLDRTSPLCSVYKNEYDYSLYTTFIMHVTTAACFGYTYVAIIRLDVPLNTKTTNIQYIKLWGRDLTFTSTYNYTKLHKIT